MNQKSKYILKANFYITLLFLVIAFRSVSQPLVNPNATPQAKELKAFLDSIYGKKLISGQAFESVSEQWLVRISNASGGKLPAILSLDFMNSMPWRVEHGADPDTTTGMAIDWVKNKGGIAEMHWHWDAPKNTDFATWQGFYTENTTFDLPFALSDTNSEEYQLLIRDMDIVAGLLKRMQDEGIAILWRPLHEAEGTWFWWGAHGGNACKELWHIMYNRFVNYHGLNNLIWVWNSYGTTKQNWYPGDDVVDIIAWDYPDYNQNTGSWAQYQNLFGDNGKLFALGEDGKLTDPDVWENQRWLYFITWAYMIKDPSQQNGKNTEEWINAVYNDPRVLTLDDLQKGPKAKPGRSQLIFDHDGDGVEQVMLDASASYTDSGFITSYLWTEFDAQIASGISLTVTFNLGKHNVRLTIETSIGERDSAEVLIEIKTPSLSLNKPVTVSSTEANLGNIATNGVDGNMDTRWSSAYKDPQWYQVDLGKPYDINEVIIYWEAASAKEFRIDQSNDGQTWYAVVSKNNMPAGARTDKMENLPGGARYIRMYGLKRTTNYGYSMFEFEVYGTENPNAEPVGDLVTSNKEEMASAFTIYPTLVKKNTPIHVNPLNKNITYNLHIFNTIGESVLSNYHIIGSHQILVDEQFVKGVYILRMECSNGIETAKFIVE